MIDEIEVIEEIEVMGYVRLKYAERKRGGRLRPPPSEKKITEKVEGFFVPCCRSLEQQLECEWRLVVCEREQCVLEFELE